ncbi:uncharacterized protein KY384_001618 [Bacidia gigantensis]|uniref:uncharacterized protein n=1 Tax=Bacidia gigantensis TaxID=2732470 RepID=UPI001D041B74|nr:uncharacterized protein KY384_001618 [Bacidia gigantensis]KAG8533877.1 hypothetical protein KY384_001618 [Bacidia gigantensis]
MGPDDWWMIVTMICNLVGLGFVTKEVQDGEGRHMYYLSKGMIENFGVIGVSNLLLTLLTTIVFSALSDIILATTPLLFLSGLQISLRTKIALWILMGAGYITAACAIVRTALSGQILEIDQTYAMIPNAAWRATEVNLGIVCANAPILRPLYLWWRGRLQRKTKGTTHGSSYVATKGSGGPGREGKSKVRLWPGGTRWMSTGGTTDGGESAEGFSGSEETRRSGYTEATAEMGLPLQGYNAGGNEVRKSAESEDACVRRSAGTGEPEGWFDDTRARLAEEEWQPPQALFPYAERSEVLYGFVQKIADEFATNASGERYKAVARSFRIPYWDWTVEPEEGEPYFPSILTQETLVKFPVPGSQKTAEERDGKPLRNPLYQFEFKSADLREKDFRDDDYFSAVPKTVRRPDGKGVSNHKDVEDVVAGSVNNLRETSFLLLSSYLKYKPFSNDKWALNGQDAGAYGSLEDIHNGMHGNVGGGGHMGQIPYAAFDPVFWLHHTNIDRLFAIWQALNPGEESIEKYVTTQPNPWGTFITTPNSVESIDTPLTPFGASGGEYYTSAQVKKTEPFGYAYPETQAWKYQHQKDYYTAIIKALRERSPIFSLAFILAMGSQAREDAVAKIKKTSTFWKLIRNYQAQEPEGKSKFLKKHHATSKWWQELPRKLPPSPDIGNLASDGKYLDWIVNIKTRKHGLGPYNVHVFLGDYDKTRPAQWLIDADHVGALTVLGANESTGCEKCIVDAADDMQVTGQVPLTLALVERYLARYPGVRDLSVPVIERFLQENLHWDVALTDGSALHRGEISDLTVSVITNEVTVPASPNALPTYAPDVTLRPEITTKADTSQGGRGEGTGLTQNGINAGGNV